MKSGILYFEEASYGPFFFRIFPSFGDSGCLSGGSLLPGSGHQAYIDAFDLLVEPALIAFHPDLIVVACGLDANGVDPLARMLAHADTFRHMTARLKLLAQDLCQSRLVLAHEGGYSEVQVPFCGLAVIEALSGITTDATDPLQPLLIAQQPPADMIAFQRNRLEQQAKTLNP